MHNKIRILVVFANPRGTDSLRLGTEDRVIREAIKLSHQRENISLTICHATTVHDLRRALLDGEFRFVHISGHGTGTGLVLEDELGGKYVVPQGALAELLSAYCPPIECVVLNACYSISQGQLTSLGVPFTIAMEGPISDDAAIEFSRGFYDAVGASRNIDFAYAEGCRAVRLAVPHTTFVSRILKKGEKPSSDLGSVYNNGGLPLFSRPDEITHTQARTPAGLRMRKFLSKILRRHETSAGNVANLPASSVATRSTRSDIEPMPAETKALVGLAIDLSGSMAANIRNDTGGQVSRLEGFRQSLERLVNEAKMRVKEGRANKLQQSIDIFGYGFGLRAMNVCDLLSLIKIGQHVITRGEIEELKQRYIRELQSNYSGYAGLGDLAKQLGFGDLAREAESVVRSNAEAEIRRKIMLEVKRRLEQQLQSIGDTTLSIEDVAKLWENSGETLTNAEELIFGSTPMRECMLEVAGRFEREVKLRGRNTKRILFVLSDGEPTDGDPLPVLEQVRAMEVTVVSCFVTDQDIANPRVLFGEPEEQWSRGAKLMFDMASKTEEDSAFVNFLLRKNWTIKPNSRLFVQVNHSAILEEFIRVVISPFEASSSMSNLPVGV